MLDRDDCGTYLRRHGDLEDSHLCQLTIRAEEFDQYQADQNGAKNQLE